MIIENLEVMGIEGAMRGMRNPLNSWAKNDTKGNEIGPNDLSLAQRLIVSGPDHRKFLRMMHIQMDIVSSFFWWKEFDTYKVGTVSNSCSTMHTIAKKPITIEDFTYSDLAFCHFSQIVDDCESLRQKFVETKDKRYWRQLIELLPTSYNQRRTIDMNYEVALKMYFARNRHKLQEWRDFCEFMTLNVPYFSLFVSYLVEARNALCEGK